MKKYFLFQKGFKIFMAFIFLTANTAMLVLRSDIVLSDFTRSFINGVEMICAIAWIIYVVICAVNKEKPFNIREE